MLKVVQINAVDSTASTGTVMRDIQDVCLHSGIDYQIAYCETQRLKQKHFLFDKILYRQIADWFCFLQSYQEKIEWSIVFCDKWRQYGFDKFAILVNSAVIETFALKPDIIPGNSIDKELGHF